MLERLGARAVVRRHDEQDGIDLAGPDEHVADEPVVAGHIHEVDRGAVVEIAGGRYPTSIVMPRALLLGQPVGIDPGQGAEQRRLAVVDVAGRADDDRRPRSAADAQGGDDGTASERVVAVRLDRPEIEHHSVALDPPDRPAAPGRGAPGRRSRRPAATSAIPTGRHRRARAASRRRRSTSVRTTRRRSPIRGAATTALGPLPGARRPARRSPARPGSRRRPARRDRARAWRRRPARVTLSGRIARASGSRRSLAIEVRPPDDEPGLRPADELVAAERHEIGAGREPLRRHRLVGESERAPCRGGRRCRGRRRRSRRARARARRAPPRSGASTKPVWTKFERMDPQHEPDAPGPSESAASKSATRVRFVVPTSTSRAPARRTISGIRTPPPISTSSPAGHGHAAAASRQPDGERQCAAALLFTTSASSAPVSAMSCLLGGAGNARRGGRCADPARGAAVPRRRGGRPRWRPPATPRGRGWCGR